MRASLTSPRAWNAGGLRRSTRSYRLCTQVKLVPPLCIKASLAVLQLAADPGMDGWLTDRRSDKGVWVQAGSSGREQRQQQQQQRWCLLWALCSH